MTEKPTYVLGINAYDHDVSACLVRDGEIAFAITKERITREKHDSGFFDEVVDYCLEAEGITLDDVELVVRNCYVMHIPDMEKRLKYEDMPEYLDSSARERANRSRLTGPDTDKLITLSHHMAHAYSAFAVSPHENGVVMVIDGVGSYASDVHEQGQLIEGVNPLARESESYYHFEGSKLTPIKKVWLNPVRGFLSDEFFFMPGLGALYSRVSSYIFADWNKCGEVMGLAPFGRPNQLKPLLDITDDGELIIHDWADEYDRPYFPDDEYDWEESPHVQHWEDMAWQIQHDTERVMVKRAQWLRESTGATNLCMAGGVALNCVGNGFVARESGFDNVWVQPAAGDDGIAIGCAYYGYLELLKKPRTYVMEHAFLGREHSQKEIDDALSSGVTRFEVIRKECGDICKEAAQLLADGNVFGWFQGRSEFGPRALGNRSIIADPRTNEMKDKLNKRVKHRQAFRPFAPIVLAERSDEIFEGTYESPYMLMAKDVRPEWRDRVAGIVHVDNTARIQTVTAATNPRLYRLLKEFDAITGVPVLVNTSFNVKGEPIVEAPEDAIDCFLATGIDYLALHDLLIHKSTFHKAVSPMMRMYTDMSTMVRTGVNAVD
jgi:carbamoyltransferase